MVKCSWSEISNQFWRWSSCVLVLIQFDSRRWKHICVIHSHRQAEQAEQIQVECISVKMLPIQQAAHWIWEQSCCFRQEQETECMTWAELAPISIYSGSRTCRRSLSSPMTEAVRQSMISEKGSSQPLLSMTGTQAACTRTHTQTEAR